MTAQTIHIGTTRVTVDKTFGKFTLAVSEVGHAPAQVGTFASDVEASRFVAAVKRGVESIGFDPENGRKSRMEGGDTLN